MTDPNPIDKVLAGMERAKKEFEAAIDDIKELVKTRFRPARKRGS